MAFIETIAAADAEGDVRAMYERQQAAWGYVPNYAKVFCHRPEVLARWARLLAEIRRPMDDRRFELATFAAAHALRHTACSLAHGKALADFIGEEAVCALARGERAEPLTEAELAIAAFARDVALDAASITAGDFDALRAHGLTDVEIFDVAAAAAGRAFFTKLLDALGVEPEASLNGLSATLKQMLVKGREIGIAEPERLPA